MISMDPLAVGEFD